MFKKLHIQMTVFSTLITGAILVFMTLTCLVISERGIRETGFSSFSGNASSCLYFLESQKTISRTWATEVLRNYGIRMELRDNGNLLFGEPAAGREETKDSAFFEAAHISDEREGLDVENGGMVSARKEAFFQMEDYYACTALIPREGGLLTAIFLRDLSDQKEQILRQRVAFGLAAVLALAALAVFSWIFTGKMIRPLEDSRRKQTEFIAAASHELRSPLAVILSSIQAMEGCQEKERSRFLFNIKNEGERMARLVQDMLSLANADNHSWAISPSAQELDTLLLDVFEKFEPIMAEKGLSFTVELPEDEVTPCFCDGARITQALSVLLDNGASYVPKGGRICLGLTEEESQFVIRVSDNGPGIPEGQQEEIFRRFYRADTARKDKQHFGLGLSIAREILTLPGGSLTAETTPGGGATFVLCLPRKKMES